MDPFTLFIARLITLLSEQSSAVTTLVIAFLGFLAWKKSQKKSNGNWKQISEKVEKVEKIVKTPGLSTESLKIEVEERSAARKVLHELLDNLKANRSYMFKFHNGTRYYTNRHQTRCTCEVEVVESGTSPMMMLYQNTPVHSHPSLLELIKKGEPSLLVVSDIPEEFTIEKEMYEKTDAKVLAVIPIPDVDSGLLLGFIGVSWTSNEVPLPEIIKPLLTAAAHAIQKIMDIQED